MVSITMEITTTRDIARQILRHRSFSFQEFSQRYADPTSDLGFVTDREARLQDTKNRQNSIEIDEDDNIRRLRGNGRNRSLGMPRAYEALLIWASLKNRRESFFQRD
jgi:thymidylate synthase ThyX